MLEEKKKEESKKRTAGFLDEVVKEAIRSSKRSKDKRWRHFYFVRGQRNQNGPCPEDNERLWWKQQKKGCLICKKIGKCHEMPPFFINFEECLCCGERVYPHYHLIYQPYMENFKGWMTDERWDEQYGFRCRSCYRWKEIFEKRYRMNTVEQLPNDLTTIYEQLQTVQGLGLIQYATMVEEAVGHMSDSRKLLEKQRIEMNFAKK